MSSLVLQRADMGPANEPEHMQIKEECSEDDMWKNNPEDKLSESKLIHTHTSHTETSFFPS